MARKNISVRSSPERIFQNSRGKVILGTCEDVLNSGHFRRHYRGKVQLIFTSPPFPLNQKKNTGTFRARHILSG